MHVSATILGGVTIEDPDGQLWRVTRRWVPWRRRRWRDVRPPDLRDTLFVPDDSAGLVLLLVVAIGVVLATPLLVPLILAAELLLALVPFAVLGRMALGRHWYVESSAALVPVDRAAGR